MWGGWRCLWTLQRAILNGFHRAVHVTLHSPIGQIVSEDVRRDLLSREFRHLLGCRSDGAAHDMDGAEACQALSMCANEQWNGLMSAYASFVQQVVDGGDEVAGQGHHTLLSALAAKHDLRACSVQCEVRCLDAERFGDPGPGARKE